MLITPLAGEEGRRNVTSSRLRLCCCCLSSRKSSRGREAFRQWRGTGEYLYSMLSGEDSSRRTGKTRQPIDSLIACLRSLSVSSVLQLVLARRNSRGERRRKRRRRTPPGERRFNRADRRSVTGRVLPRMRPGLTPSYAINQLSLVSEKNAPSIESRYLTPGCHGNQNGVLQARARATTHACFFFSIYLTA